MNIAKIAEILTNREIDEINGDANSLNFALDKDENTFLVNVRLIDEFLTIKINEKSITQSLLEGNLPENTMLYSRLCKFNSDATIGSWFVDNIDGNKPLGVFLKYTMIKPEQNLQLFNEILDVLLDEYSYRLDSIKSYLR